jgi:hypothetical protein
MKTSKIRIYSKSSWDRTCMQLALYGKQPGKPPFFPKEYYIFSTQKYFSATRIYDFDFKIVKEITFCSLQIYYQ